MNNQLRKMSSSNAIKQTDNNAKESHVSLLKTANALKTAGKIITGSYLLTKGVKAFKSVTKEAIDAMESQNLFAVAMNNVSGMYEEADKSMTTYYTRAKAFQSELNKQLNTYKPEMMNYQAKYFSALKANMDEKTAYFLSEQLTKAGIDLASLYNTTVDDAMNKIQSGILGQTKGLRQLGGIDVTEATLQTTASSMGIEKLVKDMSFAEKEVMRYIAIYNQAGQAQGDFARTIDQPANQLRMLQNNFKTLANTIGSAFMGLLQKVLPVINGVVLALTEMVTTIAGIFGVSLEFNFEGIGSSVSDISDGVEDIGSGLDNATASAKEFQKQIMGFDEINNITPPSKSGGSGGGGGGSPSVGTIDDGILKALKEWQNGMGNINSKAEEIKNKILSWFQIEDYGKYLTNFELIKEIVESIGLGLLGWKLSGAVTTFFEKMGALSSENAFKISAGIGITLGGGFLEYKGVKHILDYGWSKKAVIEAIAGTIGTTTGIGMILSGLGVSLSTAIPISAGIALSVAGFSILKHGIDTNNIKETLSGTIVTAVGVLPLALKGIKITAKAIEFGALEILTNNKYPKALQTLVSKMNLVDTSTGKLSTGFAKLAKTLIGTGGLVISAKAGYNAMKDLGDGTKSTSQAFTQLGISVAGAVASGALIGSQFGTVGIIVGATASAMLSLGSAVLGLTDSTSELNAISENSNRIFQDVQASVAEYKNKMNEINAVTNEHTSSLVSNSQIIEESKKKLVGLVDENGRVVGSEESVKAILEELNSILGTNYSVVDGQITQNGKMVDSFDNLTEGIDKYTEAYILNSLKRIAQDKKETAIQRIIETNNQYEKLTKRLEEAEEETQKYEETARKSGIGISKSESKKLEELRKVEDGIRAEQQETRAEWVTANEEMRKSTDDIVVEIANKYNLWAGVSEETKNKLISSYQEARQKTKVEADGMAQDIQNATNQTEQSINEMATTTEKTLSDVQYKQIMQNKMDELQKGINTGKIKPLEAMSIMADEMKNRANINTYSQGQNIAYGLKNGIESVSRAVLNAVSSLATMIKNTFNLKMEIHSPSRVMMESGRYISEGIAVGIEQEASSAYKAIEQLGEGISVRAEDFSADAQFGINKSIAQNIDTQANATLSTNVSSMLEKMISNAVQNVSVDVQIEAKTEEGVIVKKVVNGIQDYVMQTGEMPFDVVF